MVATISRAEVLRRAATIWTPGTVPYSMVTNHQPDGYRQDCSGYVSLCWNTGAPGGSTVTMAPPDPRAVMVPIGEADLKPGDAIGKCGPGTGGADGHIQLFEARDPDGTGLWIWEQAGGTMGPRRRKVKTVGQGSGFTPWRFVGITDGPISPPRNKGDDMIRLIEKNGRQYIIMANALSETGFSWVDVTDKIQPQVRVLTEAWGGGLSNTADARTNQFGQDSWKASAFGKSTAEVRLDFMAETVAKVVAALPPGQGGSGPTLAQIAAAVRAELDRTKLSGVA